MSKTIEEQTIWIEKACLEFNQSQTQELIEKNRRLVDMLKEVSRRINILKTEPYGIVHNQMIHSLEDGIDSLINSNIKKWEVIE